MRSHRLCETVDDAILTHAPGLTLFQYRVRQTQLERGQAFAETVPYPFPDDSADFIEIVLDLHWLRFGVALRDIAGRFRRAGELAEFGGSGHNRLEGSEPHLIEAHLRAVHRGALATERQRFGDPTKSDGDTRRFDTAHRAAMFLERFFRVHPFVDGNGRVARQLTRLFVERDGVFTLPNFSRDPDRAPPSQRDHGAAKVRSRRKYVEALEFAHRHVADSTHPAKNPHMRDPYVFLRRWIDAQMEPFPPLVPEEASGPPSWAGDDSFDVGGGDFAGFDSGDDDPF